MWASLARPASTTPFKLDNSTVSFRQVNIHSLTHKRDLEDLIKKLITDFLCLSETSQQPNDLYQLNDSAPPSAVFLCYPRGNGKAVGWGGASKYIQTIAIYQFPNIFLMRLEHFGLSKFIDFATHIIGHTLDLICWSGLTPSNYTAPCLCAINLPYLMSETSQDSLCTNVDYDKSCITAPILIIFFSLQHCFKWRFNSLASLKITSVSFPTNAPWFHSSFQGLKCKGNQLDRLYIRTGLNIHKDMYKSHLLHCKDSIASAKSVHFTGLITFNTGNTRT